MHPIASHPRRLQLFVAVWIPATLILVLAPYRAVGGPWDQAWPLIVWAVSLTVPALATWHISRSWTHSLGTGSTFVAAAASALASAGLWLAAGYAGMSLLGPVAPILDHLFPRLAALWLALATSALLVLLATHIALSAMEEGRLAAQRALQANLAARDAELRALRAQVNPHFLFNCLNSISALTTADPVAARRMCLALADFFRDALQAGSKDSIRLGEEVALAQRYLEIERVRFGERLAVVTHIDADAADASVPPLLLQPLVENAVVHGIASVLDGGTIRIVARRIEDHIQVTVSNPNDADGARPGLGIGLSNVRARLETIWPGRSTVGVEAATPDFSVTLTFPVEGIS